MHGCDDHHRTSRLALFRPRRVVERMPIPEELLADGADAFYRSSRSRRDFLQGGIGAVLALSAATRMRPWDLLETSIAEAAANPQNIIVTVYLNGGNDGLNTLLPLTGQDRSIYEAARPRLKIAPGSALAVPGHADLGWHPQLASLKTLFDESKVGAYVGVDYPNPDYSHFQSVYYWRTGQLKNGATTGWLGNWLDAYGSATTRSRASPCSGRPTTCCARATRRPPPSTRRRTSRTTRTASGTRTGSSPRTAAPPGRPGRRPASARWTSCASRSTSTTR